MSLIDLLFGEALASEDEGGQRVGWLAGVPMLGLDALSSAAYGPEAAMTLLIPFGALGIGYIGPISAIIISLLVVVYFSYQQTIGAYPTGGGSYTVARRNLGVFPGLLAGVARTAAVYADTVPCPPGSHRHRQPPRRAPFGRGLHPPDLPLRRVPV